MEMRGVEQLLIGRPARSQQVLKWHEVGVLERWGEMMQDPVSQSIYGAEWPKKRMQVPPAWRDRLVH